MPRISNRYRLLPLNKFNEETGLPYPTENALRWAARGRGDQALQDCIVRRFGRVLVDEGKVLALMESAEGEVA